MIDLLNISVHHTQLCVASLASCDAKPVRCQMFATCVYSIFVYTVYSTLYINCSTLLTAL